MSPLLKHPAWRRSCHSPEAEKLEEQSSGDSEDEEGNSKGTTTATLPASPVLRVLQYRDTRKGWSPTSSPHALPHSCLRGLDREWLQA